MNVTHYIYQDKVHRNQNDDGHSTQLLEDIPNSNKTK